MRTDWTGCSGFAAANRNRQTKSTEQTQGNGGRLRNWNDKTIGINRRAPKTGNVIKNDLAQLSRSKAARGRAKANAIDVGGPIQNVERAFAPGNGGTIGERKRARSGAEVKGRTAGEVQSTDGLIFAAGVKCAAVELERCAAAAERVGFCRENSARINDGATAVGVGVCAAQSQRPCATLGKTAHSDDVATAGRETNRGVERAIDCQAAAIVINRVWIG